MIEWTGLISYLLYGLFGAILKKNTIKTPEVPLVRAMTLFIDHTKEVSVG